MKKKPYIIAFFIFLIDFFSKQIISHTFTLNQKYCYIKDFFYITYVKNTGAAFSILKDQRIPLLIVTVIILFILYKNINKEKMGKIEVLSYGLIIGGVLGNFFDRLMYGYVIDFLDFYIFGYDYPVFNLADSFIVIGITILIIYFIRKDHYERSNS